MTSPEADLTGWTSEPFTAAGFTHDVYRKGAGPGVVLIPEMPGLHPGVLALGNHLVDNGFTVAAPSLFGTPGAPGIRPGAVPVMLRGCVAKDSPGSRPTPTGLWRTICGRSPETSTRRRRARVSASSANASLVASHSPRRPTTACSAPVLSQPSLPLPLTPKQRRDPGLSEAELKVVERRAADEGLCALGLRFSEDPLVPAERFKTLKDRLGDAFEVIEINSKKGNEHGFGKMAHSVLTLELREQEGHPTNDALNRVVEFLTQRLT
jgi:dienelactone hydrolase